jgi:hypothetical protein
METGFMAKKAKSRRGTRVRWTGQDLKALRKMAGKESKAGIARALKRSVAAVQYKAHIHRISLAMR